MAEVTNSFLMEGLVRHRQAQVVNTCVPRADEVPKHIPFTRGPQSSSELHQHHQDKHVMSCHSQQTPPNLTFPSILTAQSAASPQTPAFRVSGHLALCS